MYNILRGLFLDLEINRPLSCLGDSLHASIAFLDDLKPNEKLSLSGFRPFHDISSLSTELEWNPIPPSVDGQVLLPGDTVKITEAEKLPLIYRGLFFPKETLIQMKKNVLDNQYPLPFP